MSAAAEEESNRMMATLIGRNIGVLRQALAMLERIDDTTYAEAPLGLPAHRAGAQLRHVLEFYECFLDGIEAGTVDYDARRRDGSIAGNRAVAMGRIRATIGRLAKVPRTDRALRVRMEDSPDADGDCVFTTSVGRELQVLLSHSIHHFALIAVIVAAHGAAVDADFGVAPSTLRYQREQGGVCVQ